MMIINKLNIFFLIGLFFAWPISLQAQSINALEVGYNYRYPGQFLIVKYDHKFAKCSSISAGINVSINRNHNRSLNTYFYNRIAPANILEAIGLSLSYQLNSLKTYYGFHSLFCITMDNNYSSSYLKFYSHHFEKIITDYLNPYSWSEFSASFGLKRKFNSGFISARIGYGICLIYGDYGIEVQTGVNEIVSNAVSKNIQISYAFYLD